VALGIDLTKLNTVGDLQGGMEEAERFLGLKVVEAGERNAPSPAAVLDA
jgi:rsbT co-antagonist protein RsbR